MKITDIEPCIKISKEDENQGVEMYVEFGDQIRITDNDGVKTEGRFYYFESGSEVEDDDVIYIVLEDENQYSIGVSLIADIEKIEK